MIEFNDGLTDDDLFDDNGEPTDAAWERVHRVALDAMGMTFDGCHKIYLLLDQDEVEVSRGYGQTVHEPDVDRLRRWYDDSCSLRFIECVQHNPDDPIAGYGRVIPQHFVSAPSDA